MSQGFRGSGFRGGFRAGYRAGYQEARGGGRGGFRGGRRGRGRRPPPQAAPQDAAQGGTPVYVEKQLPLFCKIKDIKPGSRSCDLIVKVADVNLESTRTERRRGGRTVPMKCSEALVGDETGCVQLSTRLPEKAQELKEGATVALLNVKLRRVGEQSWIDVDDWAAIKPLDACKDLIPEGFNTDFQLNRDNDRSRKTPPKPTFTKVDELEPETKGLHLIVKVVEFKVEERSRIDGSKTQVAEATVGDDKACIILVARGNHTEKLKTGVVLVIFNAHIEMYKGFMRLVVDRWSDMKELSDVGADLLPESHITAESNVNATNNKSTVEYELQLEYP